MQNGPLTLLKVTQETANSADKPNCEVRTSAQAHKRTNGQRSKHFDRTPQIRAALDWAKSQFGVNLQAEWSSAASLEQSKSCQHEWQPEGWDQSKNQSRNAARWYG